MKKPLIVILLALLGACDGTKKDANRPYVLAVTVEAYEKKKSAALIEKKETDTVEAANALAAYGKGIQKYAAVLMHIQQFPDSIKGTKGLAIFDEQGNDVVPTIPQHQRDSVIMNFIQFARRSTIPYYDRVKDFELKLMSAR
ncbi:hypothetical protein JHJ32_13710 [Parapedobacter sp. ISTM3]|uniref:Lipoprotein n=1 Tax=Parapedobacter luteus TaxID=623280 RepID=A0A1T5E3E1_9SPHI|nr:MULTISPECIES: hypothetical protein [Parapedobacter]MBK1441051.1 hypothetical protein [Parapedobacter sp. ISTM3]SKB78415.1 hypothetical protein SAMN05660226_03128 [Parapedobacter luteus]